MFKTIIFLVFCGGVICEPSTPKPGCGEIPNNILSCLKNPPVVSPEVLSSCRSKLDQANECEIMTCVFRENNWLTDNNDRTKVDKPKVISHYTQLGKDKPEWKTVLDYAVPVCMDLVRDVDAQGAFIDCPAYDILHCVLTSFIKKTEAAQWDSSSACAYPRQYAANCPVCPSECFAPKVPVGSCSACHSYF